MEVTTFVQIPLEQYETLKKERDEFEKAILERKNFTYILSYTRFTHYIDGSNETAIKAVESKVYDMQQQLKEKERMIDDLIIENTRLKQLKKRWLW